jgi:competence protein ComEC
VTAPAGAAAAASTLPEPIAPGAELSDLGAVGLALAAVAGAWCHLPIPIVVTAPIVVGALARRRWLLLIVGVGLLASGLGHRALDGLGRPPVGAVEGVVTLVSDPARSSFGASADVRLASGTRVQLRADGGAAGALDRSLAGERLAVVGTVRAPPPGSGWMVPRHLAGTLEATEVERVDGGRAPWRAANRIRRLLGHGVERLPPDVAALYLGIVLGDDRAQRPEITDDFRGAGLTHLLVVSGQNVAFILLLARPLTERVGPAGRAGTTLVVIAAFATVTRFEPSVLRASAMAAIAVGGQVAGRPSPTWRTLALAITALVLVDPLLVRSIGFQLSASASLALALLAGPIARRLRGPLVLRDALAASLAAQIGVAPILLPLAGGLPVVSIPANVLAVPVAGTVTTFGLPAGVLAGVVGPEVGRWIHLPTELAIRWVAGVARVAAVAPLGQVGVPHVGALLALALAVVVVGRARSPAPVRGGLGVIGLAAALVLLEPASALRAPVARDLQGGGSVHRQGGATVVVAPERPFAEALLEDLRLAGVRRIDLLVVEGDATAVRALLEHRWSVARVLDQQTPAAALVVGGLEVVVAPDRPPVVRARAP